MQSDSSSSSSSFVQLGASQSLQSKLLVHRSKVPVIGSSACSPVAAVFDMDGTLLDTEPLSTRAIELSLADFGQQNAKIDQAFKNSIIGMPGERWSTMVLDTFLYSQQPLLRGTIRPTDFVKRWEEHLDGLFCRQGELMPGVAAVVEQLSRRGTRLAIATSSRRASVEVKMKRFPALFAAFEVIVCGDEVQKGRGKPEPDIFLLAAERMGLEPSCCVAFEDSLNGLRSARQAGMLTCYLPDLRFSSQTIPSATPDCSSTVIEEVLSSCSEDADVVLLDGIHWSSLQLLF